MALTSIIFSSIFKLISVGSTYDKNYKILLNEVEQSTLLYKNTKDQIRALEGKICWMNLDDIKRVHRKLGDYLKQFQSTGKIMAHLRSQNLELTDILRRSRSLSRSRTPEKDAGYLANRISKFKIYYDPEMYSEQLRSIRDWLSSEIDNARKSKDIGVKCAKRPAGTIMRRLSPPKGTARNSGARISGPRISGTVLRRRRSPPKGTVLRRRSPPKGTVLRRRSPNALLSF